MLSKADALKRLAQQIDKVAPLRQLEPDSPEFRGWLRDTEVLIEQIFGTGTRHSRDFKEVYYSPGVSYVDTPDEEYRRTYSSGLDHAVAVLQSMATEAEQYGDESADSPEGQQLRHPEQGVAVIRGRDGAAKESGGGLELPDRVTIPWLVRHVPVGLWLSFGALVLALFIAGAKAGQISLIKEILGERPPASPTLTQNELRERVDKLIEGLNANTARITSGIVDEEQTAGRTTFSSDRQPHVEAAQRLRDLLKQEHERFQSSLQTLKEQGTK